MKIIKQIVYLVLGVFLASCSNNGKLQNMIPADAAGVICVNVDKIVEKADLKQDGKIKYPKSLREIIDGNDGSAICDFMTDLPVMGLDTECNIFTYFTTKTFGRVFLLAIDDEKAARKVVENRTKGDFEKVNGLDCIYHEDEFYALDDDVLFVGRVNHPVNIDKAAAAARKLMSGDAASIKDDDEVMKCIDGDDDISAYMSMEGLKIMAGSSKVYNEFASKMPLIEIFTESDVKAYTCSVNFNDKQADVEVKVKADDDSEYVQLLSSTLSNPSADFLKVIPVSMDYIISMSINGNNFVKLPQVTQMVSLLKKLPGVSNFDIMPALATLNGPVAIGFAHDKDLDDWNAVVAAKSTNTNSVIKLISDLASALGQAPEMYGDEYVYEYDNKMIIVGEKSGVLYVKMLNYEQTEGYANENKEVVDFFAKSPMGLYVRAANGDKGGNLYLGMSDKVSFNGRFTSAGPTTHSSLAMLQVLCSINLSSILEEESAAQVNEDPGFISPF